MDPSPAAIFLSVRARMAISLIGTGAALAAPAGAALAAPAGAALAAPAAASVHGPTAAQIRAALGAAERSKQLWATVNICTTTHRHGRLGLRGQMPSLGFATDMYMTFEVTYQVWGSRGFKPLPTTKARVLVGQTTTKALQTGRTYPFQTSTALLAGRITFEWRRSGTLLGRTTRRTTGHHSHVDFADPPGFSRSFCRLS